ncbi:MAG: hypothetical protein WCI31_06170 [Prolixibacteraceae bacterium]
MADNQRLSELIDLLIDKKAIRNQEEFSELLDKNPNVISRYATGKNEMSERFVTKVCQVFPEVNKEWLLRGFGDILLYPIQGKNKREWCERCKELSEKLERKNDDLINCLKDKETLMRENLSLTGTIARIYQENPHLPRPQAGGKSKAG